MNQSSGLSEAGASLTGESLRVILRMAVDLLVPEKRCPKMLIKLPPGIHIKSKR